MVFWGNELNNKTIFWGNNDTSLSLKHSYFVRAGGHIFNLIVAKREGDS